MVSAFLKNFAGEQVDVHAVVLIGSRARVDTPADEVSDVDLALFVEEPARYLCDGDWLRGSWFLSSHVKSQLHATLALYYATKNTEPNP